MIEIAEGEKSPYVLVKPEENKMVIKGNSFMANPPSFYEKVLQWGQTFKTTALLNVEITVGFYNTSTLKIMNMLLKNLCSNNEGKISITLFVENEDEDQINTASTITFNVGVEPKIVYYT
ncbi:MAG: DUF1987 family protein [Sphingobacteriaceae bacterium]|nr:DUF1987 family protein [Sphingobacteriaceae bacterium]